MRCKDCKYCKLSRSVTSTRYGFSCEHPDYSYIFDYFQKKRMHKMPGFLVFGKPYSEEVPVKTSPKWCPLKKGESE